MDDPQVRLVIEKALARGIISSGAAHEAYRRHAEQVRSGKPRGVVELLREVTGVDERLLAGLDDRSMIGRTLGGFQIHSKIGEGGMGAVYRATQTSLGRAVALKILDPSLACRPELAERFRREARAAARLDHPHVVQPIDFGEEDGFIYFAMELMEGGSAASRVIAGGPFNEADAIDVGIAVSRALEYAQERGLVHRDIKPDNILFSRYGTPKLADLGLVLELSGGEQITAPGIAMGTPHYMSPEQALGQRDLDVRSDMYALGATLFEILTGRTPYHGPSATSILTQHVSSPFPDVRDLAPNVTQRLAGILGRLTAKKRDERYEAARELREALEAARESLLSGNPTGAYAIVPPSGAALALHGGSGSGMMPALGPASAATLANASTTASGGYVHGYSGGAGALPTGVGAFASGSGGAGVLAPLSPRDGVSLFASNDPTPLAGSIPPPSPPVPPPLPTGAALVPLPATTPRRRLGAIGIAAAAIVAVVGILAVPRIFPRGPRAPKLDPVAEKDAVTAMGDLLQARRAQDGAYGYAFNAVSDPWTTAQAFVALSTLEARPPEEHLAVLLRRLGQSQLTKPAGGGAAILGWPASPAAADTAACIEAGSWVALALAVGGNGFPESMGSDRERVRAHLLAAQAPDGGFESIPAAGVASVRTSGTVLALAGLVMLETQDGGPRAGSLEAIERASAWLGKNYDRTRHVWFPNPHHAWGNRQMVHGISECVVWTLLEAQELLNAQGRQLPPVAREAVADFAGSYAPVDFPPGMLAPSHIEDYVYEMPDGARTAFHGVRWVWDAWRLLAAERLARTPGLPRQKDWAGEALRHRAGLPDLRRALKENDAPPWQVGECLLAANLLRVRPAGDPKAGSLYHWLVERR